MKLKIKLKKHQQQDGSISHIMIDLNLAMKLYPKLKFHELKTFFNPNKIVYIKMTYKN
jgi:hypothetical protein